MDPSLMKERELFKKMAYANPVIEKKKRIAEEEQAKKKLKKEPTISTSSTASVFNKDVMSYKTMTASSSANFSILTRIVKYMKQRYLDGDNEPLSIDEILDETNQLDLNQRQKNWLITEALINNPKIVQTDEQKYIYKPTYPLKDRKSLLRLLDRHDQKGLGGIFLEDVQESLPNADRIIKNLGDSIITISRPNDKRKVIYYNDKNATFKIDEEFQKLWRGVAVEGLDEMKIEEYLQKHGITSMNLEMKKGNAVQKRKKPTSKKPRSFKKLNNHMSDILEDYWWCWLGSLSIGVKV